MDCHICRREVHALRVCPVVLLVALIGLLITLVFQTSVSPRQNEQATPRILIINFSIMPPNSQAAPEEELSPEESGITTAKFRK